MKDIHTYSVVYRLPAAAHNTGWIQNTGWIVPLPCFDRIFSVTCRTPLTVVSEYIELHLIVTGNLRYILCTFSVHYDICPG